MFTLSAKTRFDDPVHEQLLLMLGRERPADLSLWRDVEAERFLLGGGGSFPDLALRERLLDWIRKHARIFDPYADSKALDAMSGRVLRKRLEQDPHLRPPADEGRLLLTAPRIATDAELEAVLADFGEACPKEYARWRETEIALLKHHKANYPGTPVRESLGHAIRSRLLDLRLYLKARCWVQNDRALDIAEFAVRMILIEGIGPDERAITEADRGLRIDLPSDEEVLAYLSPPSPEERFEQRFVLTLRSLDELTFILDLTWDVLDRERALHWQARRSERSTEALSHATRFRVIKELQEEVLAVRDRIWSEKGRS